MIRSALLSLALAASLISPAAAEDENENVATKLVAVAAFANGHCPGVQANMVTLAGALAMLRVNPQELQNKPERMLQSKSMIAAYMTDRANACSIAWELFGSNGSKLPGLLER